MRTRFRAILGTARIPMQVDVGFGDVIVAPEESIDYPTLLGHPAPRLAGYSRETAIAEKLHAIVEHGELNSRLKDFFDLWLLARHFEFDGPMLGAAIRNTFARRSTPIPGSPIGLTREFATQRDKQAQWRAFLRKLQVTGAPDSLADAVAAIADFLGPVLRALVVDGTVAWKWQPGGPWKP